MRYYNDRRNKNKTKAFRTTEKSQLINNGVHGKNVFANVFGGYVWGLDDLGQVGVGSGEKVVAVEAALGRLVALGPGSLDLLQKALGGGGGGLGVSVGLHCVQVLE